MMRRDDGNSDSELEPSMLPDAAIIEEGTPEAKTPSEEVEDGMLHRDVQQKTAYYDYAAEKQLSQADAKLFYQRSQLEAQKTGGSNWGNSQSSAQASPTLIPRSFSNKFEAEQAGIRRSGSVNSMKSGQNFAQRSVPLFSKLQQILII
jgi:AMP deaminase